ncbi:MAG: hypothetical protein R3F43_18995 [bacterium]
MPVRLGSLAHWEDGLLGYYVNGDFRTFRPTHAAAARQARPASSRLPGLHRRSARHRWIFRGRRGGRAPLRAPDRPALRGAGRHLPADAAGGAGAVVHATAGLLPRKSIGLRREWLTGLAKLAPTFRFGPSCAIPSRSACPSPPISAAWTWTHRTEVDRWAEEEVVHAGHEALLPPDPVVAQEGWLRFTPTEEEGSDG